MTRSAFALLVILGTVLVAPVFAQTKHSGTIRVVGADGQSVTLEELSAGTSPGRNEVLTQPIALSDATVIVLVSRAADAGSMGWPGGFQETRLAPSDLKPGDYVTVDATRHEGKLVARSITVVRPSRPD